MVKKLLIWCCALHPLTSSGLHGQERAQRQTSAPSDPSWQQGARARMAAAANHSAGLQAGHIASTSFAQQAKAGQGHLLSPSLMQHIQHIREHSPNHSNKSVAQDTDPNLKTLASHGDHVLSCSP